MYKLIKISTNLLVNAIDSLTHCPNVSTANICKIFSLRALYLLSYTKHDPFLHGDSVIPSSFLPSSRNRPIDSLVAGVLSDYCSLLLCLGV